MDSHRKEISKAEIDGLRQLTIEELYQEIAQLRTAAKQAEALWRNTFDEVAIGIVHLSLDRKWLRVNQHFCAMLGYTVDELLSKTIQEVTHPLDWESNTAGIKQLIAGKIPSYVTDKRYIHRNGNLIWGRLTIKLVQTEDGQPAYCAAVVEDITRLKQAEVALRVSEDRYRDIVEDQVDPICRFGADFRLTFVNGPYAELYGKHPAALIGQNLFDVIVPAYQPQVLAHLSSLTPQHPLAVDENPATLADGSVRWFHWTNRLLALPDGTIEYQGVGRDITDRKLADDAERQQRQLAEAMRDSLAALTSSLDVEQVMTQILASAAVVVSSDTGSIILLEGGYGRVAYSRGFTPEVAAALQQNRFAIEPLANLRNAVTHKAPYVVFDTRVAEDWNAFPLTSWIRSSIGVPIECNGQMIGLLVADSASPNFFQWKDVEALQTFAHYAGLALNNAYQATKLEQRVAERTAELQVAKEQVESILNHNSDAIILVQPDLSIVQSNAVFERLFHLQKRDNQGKSLLEFIHPEDWGAVQDGIKLALSNDNSYHLQLRAFCSDDVYLDAELSISKMNDSGCVCTLRDITERKARERQLLYYASIQESVNDAVITVDLDYRIQSWNNAAERIFGWREVEVIGQTTINVLRTFYSSTEGIETARQTLAEQGYWQGEVIQLRKDGTPRNILASITLLRDAQQVPFGMVAIARDITEQKQTVQALNESRYFTKQLVDMAPILIYVYDLLASRHIFINSNIANLLGYSVEEFSTMGQRIDSEIIHPDDLGRFLAYRKQVLASNDGQVFTIESRLRHKNGTWRWFLMQGTIFQRTADGAPRQLLAIATDITAVKQATESLRQQHDMLQQIVDLMPAIIMVKDQAGHFLLANNHAAQLYGTTVANMMGKMDADITPDRAEVAFCRQKDQEIFTTGEPLFVPEQKILGAYYQINKIPLTNADGEIDRLLVVAIDISTHKQTAAALEHALQIEKELNEHKSHFISTVSHEFRTPLTVIQTMTESLRTYRHKLTDEQIAQRLDKIFGRTQYLTAMMKDVIELARLQSRRVSFQAAPCNPVALCFTAIDEFQQTNRQILFTHDNNLPLVKLDERLLNQILSNLLDNAIKYSTDDKPVLLHLASRADTLVLTVTDQGIGIPAADIKHLDEPFYRASNVENIPGTGLGLSIVQEAVTLHGGTISVESEVGKGSAFTVQLPVASH